MNPLFFISNYGFSPWQMVPRGSWGARSRQVCGALVTHACWNNSVEARHVTHMHVQGGGVQKGISVVCAVTLARHGPSPR